MPRRLTRTIRFDPQKVRVREGIALVYDLEGFSKFFNQPDVQHYVPDFLNHISEALSNVFSGENNYWMEEDEERHVRSLLHPVHEKFLGDGALYVWTPLEKERTFNDAAGIGVSRLSARSMDAMGRKLGENSARKLLAC